MVEQVCGESFPVGPLTWENCPESKAVRRGWNPTPDLAATSRKGDVLASAQATAPDPTSVYRYYDAADLLIYVGITRQGIGRNVQHNGKAEWWQFVARQEVEHLPSRIAALAREKELIQRFEPPFNRQHNRHHTEARAAYLDFVAGPAKKESPNGIYHRLKKRLPLEIMRRDERALVLRTQLPHAPLAAAVQLTKDVTPVRGCMKYGFVTALEHHGPFTLVICQLNKKADGVEFEAARALLAWQQNIKPQFPWIRQINLIETGRL